MNPSEIAARTNANRYLPVQRVPDPQEMADLKRAKVAWEQTQGMLGLGLAPPPPVTTAAAPIGGVGTLPVTAAVVWPANHPRHPVPGHEPVDGRPIKTNKPFVPVQGTRLAAQMKEKEMTANDDVSGSDEDDSRMRHSHGTLSRIPPAATEGEPVSAAPLASVPPPIEEDPSGPSLLADQPFEPSTASPALIAARPTTASEVLSFSPQPVAHSPATHPSITSPHPHSTPPMAVVVPTPHPVSSLPSPTAPQSMDPPIPLNPTSAIAPTVTPEGLKKQPKRKPKPNPSGGKKSPSRPPASSTSPATNSAGANPPLLAPSAPTVTPTPTSRVASGSGSGGKKRPRSEVDGEPDPSRASPHLPSTRRMAVVEMSQPASHLAASTSASAPSTVPASASNPVLALSPIPPSSIAAFHAPPMTTGEAEIAPPTAAHASVSTLSHIPLDVPSIQHQTPMQLAAPHLSEPQMFSFHPDPQLADDATFWASQSMSMNQHALNIDSFTAQSQHPSSTLPPAFSQPFPSQPDPSSAILSSASSSQHAVFGSSQSAELITSRHHTPSSLHSYSDPSPSSSQSSQSQQQSLSQHHSATASKPRHPLATHPALNDGRPPEMSNPAIMKAFIAEHGALAKAKGGKPGKARFEVKPADFKVWWETKVAAGFTAAHFSNPSAMETGSVSATASNVVDSHDAERQRARQLKEQRRLEREKQLRLFEQQQRELEAELLQPQNPYHAMGRGEGGSGSGSGGGAAGIGPAYFPS
ncbi:hypothetical protein DL93DRAFT_2173516 [Clavulina sp. PMI_390]|nr:hypothetical protein DL93DRAFT_2173516 [Clavulina sp. PMI_390]